MWASYSFSRRKALQSPAPLFEAVGMARFRALVCSGRRRVLLTLDIIPPRAPSSVLVEASRPQLSKRWRHSRPPTALPEGVNPEASSIQIVSSGVRRTRVVCPGRGEPTALGPLSSRGHEKASITVEKSAGQEPRVGYRTRQRPAGSAAAAAARLRHGPLAPAARRPAHPRGRECRRLQISACSARTTWHSA